MKKPIVIIGANDFQDQLIRKAHDMGYETHVFAWKEGAVGKNSADKFYPVSIVEKEAILEICKKIKPVGVLSVASDLAIITVNYIADALGLVGNSLESTRVSTNKYLMRQCMRQNGVKTPGFMLVSSVDECKDVSLRYPLIVKPTDRSGSRGVTKVENISEMIQAVSACIEVSFEKKAIIEEFIEGEEYSAEYINYNGEHFQLAVTKKFTTGVPHFIETGHMEPADLSENILRNIKHVIGKALDALDIKNGAAHPEFKIAADGSVNVIEVGGRMGGDCIGSDLVIISTGYDFLKMSIEVACGHTPDFARCCEPKAAFVRFIFTQKDLHVLEQIRAECPSAIYRVSEIEPIGSHDVTDSSMRFGYFILSCDSPEKGFELLHLRQS